MKKAFTPTFLISELNGIQKISLKGFLIGATILTFSLFNEEAAAQVSEIFFKDFNYNSANDVTSALTDENSEMKVKIPLNFEFLMSEKLSTIPDPNIDATNLAESDALTLEVIASYSGLAGESKHSFDIGLTQTFFKLGNNAIINNNGTSHFANFESEEGYQNNNVGATTCSFRVGDKVVGKEFISNTPIKVLNGNVTFDNILNISTPANFTVSLLAGWSASSWASAIGSNYFTLGAGWTPVSSTSTSPITLQKLFS